MNLQRTDSFLHRIRSSVAFLLCAIRGRESPHNEVNVIKLRFFACAKKNQPRLYEVGSFDGYIVFIISLYICAFRTGFKKTISLKKCEPFFKRDSLIICRQIVYVGGFILLAGEFCIDSANIHSRKNKSERLEIENRIEGEKKVWEKRR